MESDGRTAKSRAVDDQPRDSNGRFGKKATTNGMYMRKKIGIVPSLRRTRAQRAEDRSKAMTHGESESQSVPMAGVKRSFEDDEDVSDQAPTDDSDEEENARVVKRARVEKGDNDGEIQAPRRPSMLSFAPNPTAFARRKVQQAVPVRRSWMGGLRPGAFRPAHTQDPHFYSDEKGGETESSAAGPATPEDDPVQPAIVVDANAEEPDVDDTDERLAVEVRDDEDEEREDDFIRPLVPPKRGGALWKPSPINFAMRRWSSTTTQPESDEGDSSDFAGRRSRGHRLLNKADARSRASVDADDLGVPNLWTQKSADMHWDLFERGSSSGEEDVVLPDSPDPSKFALQPRVSFASPGKPSSDSEEAIERLISFSPRSRDPHDSSDPDSPPLSFRRSHSPSAGLPVSTSQHARTAASILKSSQYAPETPTFPIDTHVAPVPLVGAGWDSSEELST
ncbi:hypothetical protein EVG20_g3078 [Dentipellis fragilis]|uniref:Uncharacterized protein n=1 Tax=Dentipellis fragilis TaxID=205917 RepID=A0A4Y9Z673_9AGAM|nr:hypothetical protein EVG20_g3078 [Dentipellis fragilis]